ncbi:fimbrial assembly protein [Salmonella enterica subsp. enterica]|uniref:Fimbrial assembly protein n=1 Tax=Salmonella enterica subsp. enterica serovar Macclesfield str. S-1643 TaxID=1242107 RepID=A0A2C9P3T0_SALET|nr:fimbrial protein [Salmonella enterica]EAA5485120.1 fimbrial assembly protein [Salmonella enterica subsp. enterica serovar Kouka]EBS1106089.1 fimbrial assembly protein [Salmonella enterica subsp. enterica serovar Eingedi]EBV2192181.1 fimbrial assembly protein [Salmonella enterica subsp. enterica serovar Afula]ECH9426281.1 fimbrial assembly protein [Salmonella enterica subsp. enterica]ASG18014.1 fimbrial assembly protein [Salmonella enterica subsp. enterica serovar Macclesfield str. S-1643]
MITKKYGLAFAMASLLAAGSAVAADSDTGTITFHGMVSNNTCEISLDQKIGQEGNDFDVTLDTVFVKDFANSLGSASTLGEKKFSLSVTGCDPTTVKGASAQFSSWAGSTSTEGGMLVPPANAQGAAKNVNLVLSNDGNSNTDQVLIDQTNNLQKATMDSTGTANLYYRVAYTQGQGWDATSNPVSAGTVQAQVAFTMIYE